jgi:hypothetical protein
MPSGQKKVRVLCQASYSVVSPFLSAGCARLTLCYLGASAPLSDFHRTLTIRVAICMCYHLCRTVTVMHNSSVLECSRAFSSVLERSPNSSVPLSRPISTRSAEVAMHGLRQYLHLRIRPATVEIQGLTAPAPPAPPIMTAGAARTAAARPGRDNGQSPPCRRRSNQARCWIPREWRGRGQSLPQGT